MFMGTTYEFNPLTSKFDLVQNTSELGDSSTYIKVDTTNDKIEFYVDGNKVAEWG